MKDKVKAKYVDLLKETMEKYRNIETLVFHQGVNVATILHEKEEKENVKNEDEDEERCVFLPMTNYYAKRTEQEQLRR